MMCSHSSLLYMLWNFEVHSRYVATRVPISFYNVQDKKDGSSIIESADAPLRFGIGFGDRTPNETQYKKHLPC